MQNWKLTAAAAVLCLMLSSLCWAWQGKVIAVSDTCIITVSRETTEEKLNLYGIDVPEKSQPFYEQAKYLISRLLLNKTVEVIPVSNTPSGTTSALVRVSGVRESINEQLVSYGMAWVNTGRCSSEKCREWSKVQDLARANRIGLWADPDLLPPWEWKKKRTGDIIKQQDR